MNSREKIKLPISLIYAINVQAASERLSDISTPDIISLYREEESWRVRQAMAPELSKRLSDVIVKGEFEIG